MVLKKEEEEVMKERANKDTGMLSKQNLKNHFILPHPTGRKTCCCTFFWFIFVYDLDILTFCFCLSVCVHFLGGKLGSEIICSFIPFIGRKVFREREMGRYLPIVADFWQCF